MLSKLNSFDYVICLCTLCREGRIRSDTRVVRNKGGYINTKRTKGKEVANRKGDCEGRYKVIDNTAKTFA